MKYIDRTMLVLQGFFRLVQFCGLSSLKCSNYTGILDRAMVDIRSLEAMPNN